MLKEKKLLEILRCEEKSKQFFYENSVDDIIKILKFYGIYISNNRKLKPFEEKIKESMFEKSSKSTINKNKINKYYEEVGKWKRLYEEFYQHKALDELKNIPDDKKLFSFLVGIEFYTRFLIYNRERNKLENINLNIIMNYGEKSKDFKQLSRNEFDLYIDMNLRNASKIIKSFLYENTFIENRKFKYEFSSKFDEDIVLKSLDYLNLIDKLNVINEELEHWKLGYASIIEKEKNIFTTLINKNATHDLKNFIIEECRLENLRCTALLQKQNTPNEFVMDNEKVAFISEDEKNAHEAIKQYFHIEDLNFRIWNVRIVEWLRAYAVIKKVNEERLGHNYLPDTYDFTDWMYVSTLDEWKEKFMKYKISQESAEIIVDKLLFEKSSIDIFDTPFLNIDNKIITLPYSSSIIDIATCFISLCRSNDAQLVFKGESFEKILLNRLKEKGIPAVTLKAKYNNEDYQCDLAFILKNDLFLCECKNRVQHDTLRKRYRFYNETLEEDINQMNRIASFYSDNIEIVRGEFNKIKHVGNDWRPKRIYKVLIYSAKINNSVDEIKKLIITDFSVFDALINKKYPGIEYSRNNAIFQTKKLEQIYTGPLTVNKLLNFIKEPYQIEIIKSHLEESQQEVAIDYSKLKRKYFYNTINHYY